jgi:hypothetical protein
LSQEDRGIGEELRNVLSGIHGKASYTNFHALPITLGERRRGGRLGSANRGYAFSVEDVPEWVDNVDGR